MTGSKLDNRAQLGEDKGMHISRVDTTRVHGVALLLCTGLAGYSASPTAADASAIADPEVRACVERALPQHSMTQKVSLQVVEATETMREFSGTLYWKRFDNGLAKVLFRIDESPQHQGVAVLIVERSQGEPDIFMYLPELRSDRRISGAAVAGPLLGTDFSYEDFALLQYLAASGEERRLGDIDVDAHPAYVIEATPVVEESSYSRIKTFVDKAWCLPVITQFFGHNGSLSKELRIDRAEVRQSNERRVPFRSTMHNRKQNSRTVLAISSIEIDPDLPDNLFTLPQLRQGR